MTSSCSFRVAISVVAIATAVGACRSRASHSNGAPGAASASASASAGASGDIINVVIDAGPLSSGIPVPAASVEQEINPKHLPDYAGPTGTVEGTIHVTGDRPEAVPVRADEKCSDARSFYGKVFREGEERTLADTLVAVTNYEGYVAAQGDVVPVKIIGCSYDRRVYAVTYGQRLEVSNLNSKLTFLPELAGANLPAKMVAFPRGEAIRLYPLQPGYYELREEMNRPYMVAGVYVIRFPTHAVTGLDGKFKITGIPVGKAKVSALQPVFEKAQERDIEIKDGETTKVDFAFVYKYKKPPEPPKNAAPPIK